MFLIKTLKEKLHEKEFTVPRCRFFVLIGCSIDDVTYKIDFETYGGESVETLVVVEGQSIELPISLKNGYKFLGWFLEDTDDYKALIKIDSVTKDMKLYAMWSINQYSITFDVESTSRFTKLGLDNM